MARFFELGPLVLALCLVLSTGPSPALTTPETTTSSEDATGPSPALTTPETTKSPEDGSTGSAEVNSTTSSNTSAPASGSQQDNINSTTSSNTSAPASGGNADFIKLTLLHYYSLTHNLSHSDLHLPIMPCYEHTITEQAVFFYIFFMNVFIYLLVYLFDASKPFFGHSMLNIYDLHI
ncbi:receptor-type tyrosine-protein phosphatase C-like isoform X2 [Pseudorasbora parva]|uniref:receptor-type tyrosine-protein phosphatase C-like isoform X2 n=1 Tax=Pseudorasbora parva TaxID=51549 RepID=UPI00351E4ECF